MGSLMDNPIIYHFVILIDAIVPIDAIGNTILVVIRFFKGLGAHCRECFQRRRIKNHEKKDILEDLSTPLPVTLSSPSLHNQSTNDIEALSPKRLSFSKNTPNPTRDESTAFRNVVLYGVLLLGLIELIVFGLEMVILDHVHESLPENERMEFMKKSPLTKIKKKYSDVKNNIKHIHDKYMPMTKLRGISFKDYKPGLRLVTDTSDKQIDVQEEELLVRAENEERHEEQQLEATEAENIVKHEQEEQAVQEKIHNVALDTTKKEPKIDIVPSEINLEETPELRKPLLKELYKLDLKYRSVYYPPEEKENKSNLKVRACIGPLYGTVNWNAVVGWIKYHEKRWGLTHVDIFIQIDRLSTVKAEFDDVDISGLDQDLIENTVGLNFTSIPSKDPFTGRNIPFKETKHYMRLFHDWLINQCLWNAQFYNDDYLINFDGDEYLTSDSFETLPDMFNHMKKLPGKSDLGGLAFPMFLHNYHRCSSPNPTYGSTTYYSLAPFSSEKSVVNGKVQYTDPLKGAGGQRKYIIIPNKFETLNGVHDPLSDRQNFEFDENLVGYITGRTEDGQHARLIHYRTSAGIHGDLTYSPCDFVFASCRYVASTGNCANDINEAVSENMRTPINDILAALPLNYLTQEYYSDVYADAVCYAKQYEYLFQKFCESDENECRFKHLEMHYLHIGVEKKMIWGCHKKSNDDNDKKLRYNAACYAERYPNLHKEFCKQNTSKCRVKGLERHYLEHGVNGKLIWGCHKQVGEDDLTTNG